MMDRVEQMLLRMTELQPQIPAWAKAEHMEISTSQRTLWKYTDEASQTKRRDFLYAIVHCRVFPKVLIKNLNKRKNVNSSNTEICNNP